MRPTIDVRQNINVKKISMRNVAESIINPR